MSPSPPPWAEPPARRRRRGPLVAAAAAVLVAALVAGFVLSRAADDTAPVGVEIAQYDYRFTVPEGWEQSGADATRRLVQLKPRGAPGAEALLAVRENRLSYDSDADRERAVEELRAQYEAGGARFSGFRPEASFAGRDVLSYRELPAAGLVVDWYVVFQGPVQVSVGCQYAAAARGQVVRACDQVVRTLQIRSGS